MSSTNDLFTTRQLQEILQVDRTTIYRMLKDGRLTGVKVGSQWRFLRREVENLVSSDTSPSVETDAIADIPESPVPSNDVIPLVCVQAVQDVFAEVAGVGSVTTDTEGKALTQISNCSRFCRLINSSDAGRTACRKSWRLLASQPQDDPRFISCHAGLQYARARIKVGDEFEGMLIAGQFLAEDMNAQDRKARAASLAERLDLDPGELEQALAEISVLERGMQVRIGTWLAKVAATFEHVGKERAEFLHRFRQIAAMSQFAPDQGT